MFKVSESSSTNGFCLYCCSKIFKIKVVTWSVIYALWEPMPEQHSPPFTHRQQHRETHFSPTFPPIPRTVPIALRGRPTSAKQSKMCICVCFMCVCVCVCLSVCLSICLSVCLSISVSICVFICAWTPKQLGRFQFNLPQRVYYMLSFVRLSFSSLT